MVLKDKVYGNLNITSPIIIELIKTKAFQRLKDIAQTGIPDEYNYADGFSRYEHSLGVFILLNRLGASEEEQVAGLLHDISHTAFSHLIDWVLGNSDIEDYQDNRHLSVLEQKELADILHKYNYTPKQIADYHRFHLLESDIPNLCADRLDYSLREFPTDIAKECVKDLIVHNGEIVFSNVKSAELFSENFLKRQLEHWSGYEGVTRYVLLANLIREVMEKKLLVLEDMFETDTFVINKILQTNDKKYLHVLDTMKNKDLSHLEKSDILTKKKFRYVDPKVLVKNKVLRLSEINKEFGEKLIKAKEKNNTGVHAGILKPYKD